MSASTRDRWCGRVAWLTILALAASLTYRNDQTNRSQVNREITIDDIRIRVTGEELIGFKTVGVLVRPTRSPQLTQNQEPLIRQIDQAARSPRDKLHVAVIAGEVLGGKQALARLEALSRSPIPSDLAADIASLRTIYSSNAGALDPASKARLIQRQDYFARVALSFGVPSNVEPRKSIESGARRAVIALGFVGVLLLMLLIGAVGSFILAVVLRVKGKLHRMYVPNPSANTAFLEGFAIYFSLYVIGLVLLRIFFALTSLQWEWLAWMIIPIVTGWLSLRGVTGDERRDALGWHKGEGVFREIAAGIGGYLAGIVVMIVGFILTYVLIARSGISPEHPLVHILQGDRWHVLGLYALVSVFAPVIEETMFRGALFHHLRRRWGWAITAPIVSFIFAIIHPQGWVAVPVLGSIAVVLAALREWRGSLIAPMVAHAFNNFIALSVALAVFR